MSFNEVDVLNIFFENDFLNILNYVLTLFNDREEINYVSDIPYILFNLQLEKLI